MHFTSQNHARASLSLGPRSCADITADSYAHQVRAGVVNGGFSLRVSRPSDPARSLAANLLVALLHVHEIRVLVDLLLRVPELLLELELVIVDVLLELGDLLVVALPPLGLLPH